MPAVFVNGNPETAAIWQPLLAKLSRTDVITLAPPGFGSPVPGDFEFTLRSYTQWLIAELESLGEPADLVGHDLGGFPVAGVCMTRADLVRTWVNDVLGVFDPDYVWHPRAQVWQTPGDGERSVAELTGGTLAERTERMAALGISRPVAAELAAALGPETARAILGIYRSAAQPALTEFGRDLHLAAARPGLAMIPTEDRNVTGSLELRRRSAGRAGASIAVLNGLGHRWMDQDPAQSATVLGAFWAVAGLSASAVGHRHE